MRYVTLIKLNTQVHTNLAQDGSIPADYPKAKMHVIDLFSGCGGLSCGADHAGLNVALGIERDPSASRSFAANFPTAAVLNSQVEAVDPGTLTLPRGDLIICGGPPCQGFSSSNQRNRDINNARNHLYLEIIRFSDVLQPKALVFENAYGITEGKKRDILQLVISELKRRFSHVEYKILNAVEFGIPQVRRRVFVVARQGRSRFRWPDQTSSQVTVLETLADLPVLTNGAIVDELPYRCPPFSAYAERLRRNLTSSSGHVVTNSDPYVVSRYSHIPEGGNWRDIPDHLMSNYKDRQRCHTGIYRRLAADKPSVVIGNFRKNMLIHPHEDRGLSIREAARLQSFPDDFVFEGSIGKRQQQVGNAVPPQLAAHVLRAVTDA